MKIDPTSVKNICGNSTEVMVYGLDKCRYAKIYQNLGAINYKSYCGYDYREVIHCNTQAFKLIDCNKADTGAFFKAVLTNIILENYKRSLKNESLITVFFCVNFEDTRNKTHVDLSITKLALSHASENETVTDRELSRSYKLCNEMIGGTELKEI